MNDDCDKWPYRRECKVGATGENWLGTEKPPGRLGRAGGWFLWVLFQPLVWWIRWREKIE